MVYGTWILSFNRTSLELKQKKVDIKIAIVAFF